jgi:hypothetical protein
VVDQLPELNGWWLMPRPMALLKLPTASDRSFSADPLSTLVE